ncbi:MAG: YihY family inner membrane protein [Candidatus Latescibacteria bacterium]|nr:YihY family inner membrane protein [bacterium]MBD3423251.1 YihY family inner membrane protein [Candidatus Latescibacterota bacterium]
MRADDPEGVSMSDSLEKRSRVPGILIMFKRALWNIFEDDIFTLAGAVAFFATLSLAPLLVLLLSVTGLFSGSFHQEIISELELLLGPAASRAIDVVLINIEEQELAGKISALISITILLFSSTAVFVQLQKAMNRIWGVQPRPGKAVKNWLKKRLVSLVMIMAIGFILILSILFKTGLSLILGDIGNVMNVLSSLGSIVVYIILFGSMLIYVPDIRPAWRDIAFGATVTALFFHFGKWAIGRYLVFTGIGSAYGAAGTLVIGLLWVYYSTLVVFLGTELAKAFTQRHSREINSG